jgi:sugar (pentulose or hexulose) kinase
VTPPAPDTGPVIGLDLGTSGVRAVAVAADGEIVASARTGLPAPERDEDGGVRQEPTLWWQAVLEVLTRLAAEVAGPPPAALCLDGTSATILLCTPDGAPLGPARMYNDTGARAEAQQVDAVAPADSPARGASASLPKLLRLLADRRPAGRVLALHQADWIGGRLRGRYGDSDWNNALKLGFDPAAGRWPDWLRRLPLGGVTLPDCHAPGTDLGAIDPAVAAATGLPAALRILAGTTDSTAATLAAGARTPGDAVTSLGSTLVLKIVGERPIASPAHGVYSHRLGDTWLAGGASNSGGAVLRQFFDDALLAALSARIDPATPSGLDYYPLPAPGERFPVAAPAMQPRLAPRPADDALFLKGLLEGISRIERDGYRLLRELGAPAPRRVLTVGGGADNATWTTMRSRLLDLPVAPAVHRDAAYGAARLALTAGRERRHARAD